MSQLQKLREFEAAKIARWFGDSDYGPVFIDRSGRALPVTPSQRGLWQRQASRQLDQFLARFNRSPFEMLLIAGALFAAATAATAVLGKAMTIFLPWFHPAFAAAPAILWPSLITWQFRRDQRRLRGEIAERLAFRTPLPEPAAARARRYNIFAVGQGISAIAVLALAGIEALREEPRYFTLPMLALIAIGWLLHWAARRVDAAHRRNLG